MARQKIELTAERFTNPRIIVTTDDDGGLTFEDEDGNELDRKTAMVRQYSFDYRTKNPDDAKESSRKYAASVREDAASFRALQEKVREQQEQEENAGDDNS
ncbi:hypothetical protein LCGC14_2231890 [marine sediment metagenome]|uniref:Uncharacterized protein n=1 Tax=marine sediment metagenome TaxID=412755 RepID=A0A0F9DVQ9_9ZZZZ